MRMVGCGIRGTGGGRWGGYPGTGASLAEKGLPGGLAVSSRLGCRAGAVLALAVLVALGAWGGWAQAESSGQVIVSLRIAPSIEVDVWPQPLVSLAAAVPERPVVSPALTLRVRSNASWGVKLATDHPGGLLRPWNGSGYVADGRLLSRSLEWGTNPTGPWTPFSGEQAVWLTNQPATGEGAAERTFYVRYLPTYDDMAGETEYRISVLMAAGVGY